jgi:hypothetical protein
MNDPQTPFDPTEYALATVSETACRRSYDRFDDVTSVGTPFFPLTTTKGDAELLTLSLAARCEVSGKVGDNSDIDTGLNEGLGQLLLEILNDGPELVGEAPDLVLLMDEEIRFRPQFVARREVPQELGGKRREHLRFRIDLDNLRALSNSRQLEARLSGTEVVVTGRFAPYFKALVEELLPTAPAVTSVPAPQKFGAAVSGDGGCSAVESITPAKRSVEAPPTSRSTRHSLWDWTPVLHLSGERQRIRARCLYHHATVIDFPGKAVLMISDGGGGGICCTYRGPTAFSDAREAGERAMGELRAGTTIFKVVVPVARAIWGLRVHPVKPFGSDDPPLQPPLSSIAVDELIRRRAWW